jgi:hypothetical protein
MTAASGLEEPCQLRPDGWCRDSYVPAHGALVSSVRMYIAVVAMSRYLALWQVASELVRLRPKPLEHLVHPDALDTNCFFPDEVGILQPGNRHNR